MLLADILKGVVPEKSWLEGAGHKTVRMCEFGFFHGSLLGAIINLGFSNPNSMSSKSATAFSPSSGFLNSTAASRWD